MAGVRVGEMVLEEWDQIFSTIKFLREVRSVVDRKVLSWEVSIDLIRCYIT